MLFGKPVLTVQDIKTSKNSALSVFHKALEQLGSANAKAEQFKSEAKERIDAINEELRLEQISLADAEAEQAEIQKTADKIKAIIA